MQNKSGSYLTVAFLWLNFSSMAKVLICAWRDTLKSCSDPEVS